MMHSSFFIGISEGIVLRKMQKAANLRKEPGRFHGTTDSLGLNIVVQVELPGMRAQPHGIDFSLALVRDVGLDQIGCENAAFEQELLSASSASKTCSSVPGTCFTLAA